MIRGNETMWRSVLSVWLDIFGPITPALSFLGMNPGAGASVEIACSGVKPSASRKIITDDFGGTAGVLSVGNFAMLHASAQLGLDPKTGKLVPGGVVPETQRALQNVEAVFSAAFADNLKSTATQCFLLANSSDLLAQAKRVYGQYVQDWDVPPALVVLVAVVPPFFDASVALQCYGGKE